MTFFEAMARIEREMDGAGEVMQANKRNGDNWHFDAGRQNGLKEALEILSRVSYQHSPAKSTDQIIRLLTEARTDLAASIGVRTEALEESAADAQAAAQAVANDPSLLLMRSYLSELEDIISALYY